MTIPTSASFAKITLNNQSVDQSIEKLVNNACSIDEKTPRPDRLELEKTTRLLFLSSLIMGEQDKDESED
jgi:hypothetical protein